MNIVNKLTVRHLKKNKRRTLVTMIGVIISVAMLTAVATLAVSFLDLMQKQSIADNGEWHVLYEDVNKEQFDAIKADDKTKELVISKDLGYAQLEGTQNENKPYLFIKAYNTLGFEKFPIELASGRLPKVANEVVISEAIATNAKVVYEIGDTLTLDVGERFSNEDDELLDQSYSLRREKDEILETLKNKELASYTVVGTIKRPTWENAWSPGYTILSYIDEDLIEVNNRVNATVTVKKVNSSLLTHAEDLAAKNDVNLESITFNDSLLRYYGVVSNDGLRITLLSLSAIIMGIIILGSVSLIYNAFAISVSERSRHLGMLSSVGATNRQKKKSVFFEGAIIGLISIPIGIICGLIGMGITFYFINSMVQEALGATVKLTLTVTPLSILTAILVSMLTIYISTYIPAKRASKITAIDAIRQTEDIKITGKAVKTSKMVRKLFGMEAEIGLKNLKRNKRRYQATVISLVISIVLFLSVSFFTSNLSKSLGLAQDGANYDIEVWIDNEYDEEDIQTKKLIANLDNITESSLLKEMGISSWVDEAAIANELKEEDNGMIRDGRYPYYNIIHALDEENLRAYAKEVGSNYEQLTDIKNLSGIVIDKIPYQNEETGKYVETKAIHAKAGQILELHYEDDETAEEVFLSKIKIATLTDQLPMGIQPAGIGSVDIIVSEQVFDQLANKRGHAYTNMRFLLKSKDPMATQQKIEEMKVSNLDVFNAYKSRQRDEQFMVLLSVFIYGFISLITAISVANIFNTISTSVALRKREFAMLKSVGMTPKGFNKMVNYESIFYGIKSLLYGLPISIIVMYLMHKSLMNSFDYPFALPWLSIIYVIIAIFLIVGSAMLYASSKVKRENIIDALKQESI